MHLDIIKDREVSHTEHFSRARGSDNVLAARRYEPRPNFTPEHFQTNSESVIKHRCRGNVPVAARQQCGRGLNGILPHQETVPTHRVESPSQTPSSVSARKSNRLLCVKQMVPFLYYTDKSEPTMTIPVKSRTLY